MASGHPHPFDPDSVARAQAGQLTTEQAERLSAVLGVVGDPVRIRVIFALLTVDELCVGDVALAAHVNHDAASYALRVLRAAALVDSRREGRLNYYRLADDVARRGLRVALDAVSQLSRDRSVAERED